MASFQSDLEELSDSEYCTDLLGKFQQFRDEQSFCDYVIKVEGHEFKVHRVVIAAASDYFRALFSHDMLESGSSTVDLQTLSADGLRPLLDFVYTGKLRVNMNTIEDVLPAAAFLQVTSALRLLSRFLKDKITFENAQKLVSLGENYGLTDLADYHRKMILERFLEFTDTEQFLQLDAEALTEYLEQDSLRTTTEAQLLKRVLRWYRNNQQQRDPVIHIVLDRIRYTIDGWPAIDYACSQPIFQTNKKCTQIIRRCENYMQDAHRKHLNQSFRTRVRYESKTMIQFGGIKSFANDAVLGFLLPGEEDFDEPHGTGRNSYYHRNLGQWLPLGINGNTDCRSHNPVVSVNDFGVLVGGYLYSSDMERTMQHCSNEVKLFTPGDFALWDMPYMIECRAQHVAVHTPGYIYAVGGKNEIGATKTVEQYHLDSEEWKLIKSLEMPVYDHAGAPYKNKVFISGGIVNNVIVNTVWCYEPRDDEWSVASAMLTPRAGHTMTLLGNQFIVCGGRTVQSNGRCLASVEAFDHEVKQWTFITPMRTDCAYMCAVVLDDKLMVLGGQNSVGDFLDQVVEYDPVAAKWSKYCTLPDPMKNMGCCSVTIKLTPNGEEDRDSVTEEYSRRFDDSDDENNDFYLDSDDDGEILQLHEARHPWLL